MDWNEAGVRWFSDPFSRSKLCPSRGPLRREEPFQEHAPLMPYGGGHCPFGSKCSASRFSSSRGFAGTSFQLVGLLALQEVAEAAVHRQPKVSFGRVVVGALGSYLVQRDDREQLPRILADRYIIEAAAGGESKKTLAELPCFQNRCMVRVTRVS